MSSKPATPAGASDAFIDGRFNRSVVTRQKIVEALSALILEGALTPTAEQVAARAQVGLRTVFRHFEDMETLYREIAAKLDLVVAPAVKSPLTGGSWQERLFESISRRCALYDRIAAYQIASQALRHQSTYLHSQLISGAHLQRKSLLHLLPEALRGNTLVVECLDLATSFDAWIRLRREQGLAADTAEQIVRHMVGRLIAGHG
jgi:AcrR family transcriptional regulator